MANSGKVDPFELAQWAVKVDGVVVAMFPSDIHAKFFGNAWKDSHPETKVTLTALS